MEQKTRQIIDSLNSYSSRQRTSEQNRRNLDDLDDVEVVDLVYEIYESTIGKVGKFVEGLPEGRQQDILIKITPLINGTSTEIPGAVWKVYVENVIGSQVKETMVEYELVTHHAFNKFYKLAKDGSPAPLLGLVKSLLDPKLANDLLQILSGQGVYLDSLANVEGLFVNRPLWNTQKDESAKNSIKRYVEYGTFVLGGKTKTKRAGKKIYETEIINPLRKISAMPPMWLQMLNANLNNQPIESE